jgi:2-desacetyl-2-hydroxyethyl bacteriochlorophyllide A dehydrogenase
MKRQTLYFTAPGQVEVREEGLSTLTPGQVLVETLVSAISPGTEMLVYRGQFPTELADEHDAVSSRIQYPLAYGYACVGRVVELGPQVDQAWRDRLIFSFQPHTSHFISVTESLFPPPESMLPETACFLPNAETAVNLVQDGAPILGERVLVFGQGIVGLLTAALLTEFPLEVLATVDGLPRRRDASLALGLDSCLDPTSPTFLDAARSLFPSGADLCLELSGVPAALDDAIRLTTFSGRVVIGSWYGTKRAALDLGGSFHRSRIKLISSQVSSISPELSARWSKSRRFDVAWKALERIRPEKWITQQFTLDQAPEAYRLLDENPSETIQVIFKYGESG